MVLLSFTTHLSLLSHPEIPLLKFPTDLSVQLPMEFELHPIKVTGVRDSTAHVKWTLRLVVLLKLFPELLKLNLPLTTRLKKKMSVV
jgi:hypothetical protein